MRKITGLLLITLFVLSFVAVANVYAAEDPVQYVETQEAYEQFLDLVGTVNYTVDPTGQSYEGKDSLMSIPQTYTASFALSIGADRVLYYTMADGSIPSTIEDLYEPGVRMHVLYDANEQLADADYDVGGISLHAVQDSSSENLTVDTLDRGDTEEVYSLADLIDNSSATVTTSIIGGATDLAYRSNERHITNFDDQDLLTDAPDEDLQPVSDVVGTANMTDTVYVWLARYIEDTVSGVDPYTVSIDHSTESITSEALTVWLNEKAYTEIRAIIDETLTEAGATSLSISRVGRTIGKRITARKGSFSFASGMKVSDLAKKSYVTAQKAVNNVAGSKLTKTIVKAAIATTPVGAAYYGAKATSKYGDAFASKASSKLTNFATTAGGKLKSGPFAFLGGVIKTVAKVGSFLLKYWWLWLTLLGVAIVMFATPVGPFLMSNTIRKIVR